MSSSRSNGFVQLNRRFRKLTVDGLQADSQVVDLSDAVGRSVGWEELLEERRVVLLSEAGAGKTIEIRATAKRLAQEGKHAFFLRLENLADGFEDALEDGSIEKFQIWQGTEDTAWLFLDSVDESRLKFPRDFEKAVSRLKTKLEGAMSRVHLFLTSRVSAWRPVTDRSLCDDLFPVNPPRQKGILGDDGASESAKQTDGERDRFQFFTLEELNQDQIRHFAQAKGVVGLESFLKEISDTGAQDLAARPLDLELLILKWRDEKRLGSLHEIKDHGIKALLREWDENRDSSHNLDLDQVRSAARLLAAAATLTRKQEFKIPDGEKNTKGISLDPLLPKWGPNDRGLLLQRRIFEDGNYGTVRFHRSYREFLTAEWFLDLILRGGSPRSIQSCFFRDVTDQTIVTPVMRPILPWLSLRDVSVRNRALECAPEIFLEGGDPASLPLEFRRAVLERLCERISRGVVSPWFGEIHLSAGFSKGLAEAVHALYEQYATSDSVVTFLLRLIENWNMSGAWSIVESVVESSHQPVEVRKQAIHVANAIGTKEQLLKVRSWYAASEIKERRGLLSMFLAKLPSEEEAIEWLLNELKQCSETKLHAFDVLEYELPKFVNSVDEKLLPSLVDGLERLLEISPWIHDSNVRTSQKYEWVMKSACKAVVRLLQSRHICCFESSVLAILARVEDFHFNYDHEITSLHPVLQTLVQGWPEMNRAVFWASVQAHREARKIQGQEAMTSFRQVYPQVLWGFRAEDFVDVLRCIRDRDHVDDRRVALSLAMWLYDSAERPSEWLLKLQEIVREDAELEQQLEQYLTPQVESDAVRRWREMEEKRKRAEEARMLEEAKQLQEGREYFRTHLERLKSEVVEDPGHLPGDVIKLLRICESKESAHSRWSVSNWQSLEPEYGPDVARFFRDAVVSYWRHESPQIRSEGAPHNKVTYGVLAGLAGLAIESRESPTWMENLTPTEVDRACRFASFEMNDFPNWFPKLFDRFPEEAGKFLLGQVRFELEAEASTENVNHIIQHLTHTAEGIREWLAPHLLDILETTDPKSTRRLDSLLRMVRTSSVEDRVIAKVAAQKTRMCSYSTELRAAWLAAWVGADPEQGIPALRTTLAELSEEKSRSVFAQQFITRLVGGRRRDEDSIVARNAFQTPRSLKALYDLMHSHIRVEDDIDRADGGAYSPELRDYAQDARNALYALLEQIPGEEAYRTLREIADQTPPGHSRSWIMQRARSKAEQAGDLPAWTPEAVLEYQESFLRTPRTLRELGELVILKLQDLKDNLENSDYSIAGLLIPESVQETEVRNAIGDKLRDWAQGRYQIEQEGELADRTRPDFRFIGNGFDGRIPVELKLAERWSGPDLMERLKTQLCGDYLRDARSGFGIFLLVNREKDKKWRIDRKNVNFLELVEVLQGHWGEIQPNFRHIEKIEVVGIDLTKRDRNVQSPTRLPVIIPAQAFPNRLAHSRPRRKKQISPHGFGNDLEQEGTRTSDYAERGERQDKITRGR